MNVATKREDAGNFDAEASTDLGVVSGRDGDVELDGMRLTPRFLAVMADIYRVNGGVARALCNRCSSGGHTLYNLHQRGADKCLEIHVKGPWRSTAAPLPAC